MKTKRVCKANCYSWTARRLARLKRYLVEVVLNPPAASISLCVLGQQMLRRQPLKGA